MKQIKIYKKIRKTWEINPKTRVADKNKKKKSRTKIKQEFRKELGDEIWKNIVAGNY